MARKSKCPKCKSEETVIEKFRDETGSYFAERITCKKCGKIKYIEEHGKIYYQNWKIPDDSPLKIPWYKKLFKKKRKRVKRNA